MQARATAAASALSADLTCRTYPVRAASYDAESRSVEAVIATETPTLVWDFNRGQLVEETLLMSGVRWPDNGQVPLLDSHNRSSVRGVIGSCRDLRVDNKQLLGRNYFAARAADLGEDVRDGHLTDFSVGYRIITARTIPAGKTVEIDGQPFTAGAARSLRVVTAWQLLENSLCAIGADNQAKVRADGPPEKTVTFSKEYRTMNFDKWLQQRGFELDDLSDEQAASLRTVYDAEQRQQIAEQAKRDADGTLDQGREKLIEEGRRSELDRQQQIRRLAGDRIPAEIVQRAIDEAWSVDKAKDDFLERLRNGMTTQAGHSPAVIVRDGGDLGGRALEAACLLRAGGLEDAAVKAYGEKNVEAAERIRDLSLVDLCREAIRLDGKAVPVGREEMIRTAFSTASLPQILGNVANKAMLAGYTALPGTWERWCQIGSVQDFKENTRVRLTDVGELQPVANGGEVAHGSAVEEYEKFAIATYAKQFAITRTNIINDDLSTFTAVPRKMGIKAAMKVHQLVYAHFLNPGNMSDNVALFHSDHGNKNTTNALSEANMADAIKAFRLQADADGQPISVEPKYLLVPPSLERTARKILESDLMIATGDTDAKFPNANIYKGALDLIVEPRLENASYTGNSATTWYVIADPNTIDTVEVAFLNGKRTPTVERFGSTPDTMGVIYRVYIDAGAKALDFRGMQQNEA